MLYLGILCSLFVACLARPDAPVFGGYPASGVDSYSAPGGGGGGDGSSGGGFSSPSSQYGPPAQAPIVHKHVYVHVPPPETPVYKPKKVYPAPVPRKHYKIVFIKAPTPPTPTVPDLPPLPPPDEQKTLIYVLVKRPEEQPEITIPTPAPTKPSKPEVYFIRYKTHKQEGGYPDSGVPAGSFGSSGPGSSYGAPSSSGGYQ